MNIVIDKSIVNGFVNTLAHYQTMLSEAHKREQILLNKVEIDRLLTIKQAREYLGNISEDTLIYYRRHGLDYYKKGRGGVWYREGDINSWLASGKVSRHGH